ncbi:alpha/beta fold hydrolase [Streptomyces netropsis]
MDARSNARDAEALRRALNRGKINLHGFSYGTLTAERYLGLFGEHVNGAVLEGVMNPAQSRREFIISAARGLEAVYDRFARWCAENTECALNGRDVPAVFSKARKNAEVGRIPGTLYGQPWSGVMVTRYFELASFNGFAEAAKGLRMLSENLNPLPEDEEHVELGPAAGPGAPGAGPTAARSGEGDAPKNTPFADPIVCSDFALAVPGVGQARRDLAATSKAAPVTRFSTNANVYTSICLGGPRPVKDAGKNVTSRGQNPVMLLSNTHDGATPVAWADAVARQLGNKAVHIRTDRVGHGSGMDNAETKRRVVEYMNRLNPTTR